MAQAEAIAQSLQQMLPAHAEELLEVSLRAGDFHSARDYSERLLAIDPANIEWISKRAKLELAAGNLGEALRFADKGLGIDSENEEVLELRAAALKKLRTLLATVGREADDTP